MGSAGAALNINVRGKINGWQLAAFLKSDASLGQMSRRRDDWDSLRT